MGCLKLPYENEDDRKKNVCFSKGGIPENFLRASKKCNREYQYYLKDHLGNTRVTFTTEPKEISFKATMESENASDEEATYSNISETRATFNNADANADGNEVIRLNGTQPMGAGISLPIGTGDEISLEVYAYYEGGSGYNSTISATSFVAAVAGAFGGVNGGAEASQQVIYDGFNSGIGMPQGTSNDNVPAAYLNYILFDEDFTPYQEGFKQVTTAANMNHELLDFSGQSITASKPGFVYVWVSNNSASTNWVYFDDMEVTVKEHPVIQTADYYPFGLEMAGGYQRVTAKENYFKYNGFEEQTDLDWGVYDYLARYYDPVIGRFLNIDPAADLMRRHSPYNYAFNNPIRFIDPDGMMPEDEVKCPECAVEASQSSITAKEAEGENGKPITQIIQNSSSSGTVTAMQVGGTLVQNTSDNIQKSTTTTTVTMDESGNVIGAASNTLSQTFSPEGEIINSESSSISGTIEDGKIVDADGNTLALNDDLNSVVSVASKFESENRMSFAMGLATENTELVSKATGVAGIFSKGASAIGAAIGLAEPADKIARSGILVSSSQKIRTPQVGKRVVSQYSRLK